MAIVGFPLPSTTLQLARSSHHHQWPLLMLYKLFSSILGMSSCAGDHLAEDLNIVTFGLLLAAVPRHALGFGNSLPTNYQETLNQNTSFGRYSLSSPTLSKQFLQQFATQIQQTFDIGSGLFCRRLPATSLLWYVICILACVRGLLVFFASLIMLCVVCHYCCAGLV
jgi:hypothetical protein